MNCEQIYHAYKNQIVSLTFEVNSEASKLYGESITGFFWFPEILSTPFYEDLKLSEYETQQHVLVRLAFKITESYKQKMGFSSDLEALLMNKGISCKDIKFIKPLNIIELTVIGRVNSDLPQEHPKYEEFKFKGEWDSARQSKIIFEKVKKYQYVMPGVDFYTLCNKIRNSKYQDITNILKSHKIELGIETYNNQEIDLLKSVCNIFLWLEYYFTDKGVFSNLNKIVNNNEFLPKLFNEFIIDFSSQSGSVKDIFLIDKTNIENDTHKLLEKLFELGYLSKVKLKISDSEFSNYFIPFNKLLPNQLFIENRGLHLIYKKLLDERDLCLSNFYKNR
jgi:hypothetical protein